MRYPERKVILVERDQKIAATWRYLLRASPAEILRLPDVVPGQDVASLPVAEEARYLIGWWLTRGAVSPNRTLSAWGRKPAYHRQFWGDVARERIASQVDAVRHWEIIEGDYTDAPDLEATWFIDPPYQIMGSYYRHRVDDYVALAGWCRARKGATIVCENLGSAWQDIKANESKTGGKVSREAIWLNPEDAWVIE
jgi:hypothetical protein